VNVPSAPPGRRAGGTFTHSAGRALFIQRRLWRSDHHGPISQREAAVVTGGSRGIGFAIADALSAEVAEIALLARDVVTFLASPRSVAVNGDTIAAGGGTRGPIHY
jgi:hypothetical protein